MINKKIVTLLLATSVVLSSTSICQVQYANAATNNTQAYDQQFSSVSLAKGYKDLNSANPCITQKFSADPCAMEYNGRVYVYSSNDGNAVNGNVKENDYSNINTINVMSSDDMVNWTDHGSINAAGSNGAAKWAKNSWAPTACHKKINGKDKFFLYFANNGSGIGVLTSDSPTGPWVDPIGKPLITHQTPNCAGITWLFDPAVLVDGDGTGYLYFGGGVPAGKDANPNTARVIKLGNDMTSISGTAVNIDAPYLFEDSGINKIGDTYYYSYCTNWAARPNNNVPGIAKIGYMTSKSPMGPFTYKGTCLDNPSDFLGTGGNNHHSIVTLNNKSYIVYHAEWLNKQMYGSQKGYRTTHINEINISNGTIQNAKGDLKGLSQIKNVNPYTTNQMETMAWQGGINVTGQGDTKVEMNRGDWTGVSGVQFSGTTSISLKASSNNGAVIKICTDSPTGEAIGYVNIPATGGSFKDITADVSNISGNKKLFFVASGDCIVDSWKFSNGSSSSEQTTPLPNTQPSIPQTPQTPQTPSISGTLSDGWYYIKNVNAQKYLQVTGNVGKAVQNVELGTGTGVKGQKWYLQNTSDGYITLKSALGEFMLDVNGGKNHDGTNIQIYHAYANNAQKFMLKQSLNKNAFVITTKSSNGTKALDDYNFETRNGANVCQWTYGGYNNQQWIFEKANN